MAGGCQRVGGPPGVDKRPRGANIMKVWISLLALVLGLSFVTPTMAAKGKKGARGQVTSFTGDEKKGSLTFTTGGKKNPQDVTVETDDKTSVTLDGNPAKVGDLKAGLFVMVS